MLVLSKTVHGSQLYGTNTPESDTDYKGIFVPDLKDLFLQKAPRTLHFDTGSKFSKNTKDDVDCELFSLGQFINMAIAGETIIIDMLHTPDHLTLQSTDVWSYLVNHRSEFYTTHMKSYLGYVRKQASRYGVKGNRLRDLTAVMNEINKQAEIMNTLPLGPMTVGHVVNSLPETEFTGKIVEAQTKGGTQTFYQVLGRKYQMTLDFYEFQRLVGDIFKDYGDRARKAEQNEGIDWKALSHALRGANQLKEIYETGDLQLPLKTADRVKAVKLGQVAFKDVQEELEQTCNEVESLAIIASKNGMRKEVDRKRWEEFVVDVYASIAKRELKV
ncbi:nucleotidyltransferase [Cronobacter phage S13]|uniref:nucleotidyltransferase n=1 Tax=Cronobacter phage S13 TaxID=1327935 RepID=UPI00049A7E1D|nr:nucleotidyltransferase [Cronobacter phage S13]AIA65012.1 hypothetical protein S13_215 [Cronobacter phage S13]